MENEKLKTLMDAIHESISLSKCRKCACMKKSLESMKNSLLNMSNNSYVELLHEIEQAINKTEESQYS